MGRQSAVCFFVWTREESDGVSIFTTWSMVLPRRRLAWHLRYVECSTKHNKQTWNKTDLILSARV